MINFFKKIFSTEGKAKDPVCGMWVDLQSAKYTFAFQGKTYYFCSPHCQKQFITDPNQFIS